MFDDGSPSRNPRPKKNYPATLAERAILRLSGGFQRPDCRNSEGVISVVNVLWRGCFTSCCIARVPRVATEMPGPLPTLICKRSGQSRYLVACTSLASDRLKQRLAVKESFREHTKQGTGNRRHVCIVALSVSVA